MVVVSMINSMGELSLPQWVNNHLLNRKSDYISITAAVSAHACAEAKIGYGLEGKHSIFSSHVKELGLISESIFLSFCDSP